MAKIELTQNECRVLGVLIEKAQTTPQQYPLSLNALVNGCNQKSTRQPVLSLSEDEVFDTLESLRHKGLSREIMLSGSRVAKYRHIARETLNVDTNELVILAELLLRGPQTLGELRGRASRMHPIESLDIAQNVVQHLIDRDEPLVKPVPPEPGSRAGRFIQLLCPDLHQIEVGSAPAGRAATSSQSRANVTAPANGDLEARVAALERKVAALTSAIEGLTSATTS